MRDTSDARLLTRFRDGDEAALDALLVRYEAPLFQFLVGLLRDHHQAEDALQETFVRALERLDDVDPEHLRGWLFTVAYHQALVLRRRSRTRAADPLTEAAATDADPGELAARADEAVRLRRLLGLLPAAQQEVIRQRVYEGKRFRDIAEDLCCPLSTALARMHEGLKRLRLLWGKGHA
jgi:RNA polymerase sigma-70 factor (ECF subfamily)